MNLNSKNSVVINGIKVGVDHPCFIIAEIGINHNGDLISAKKLIDAAIQSGADAVKFQKRNLKDIYRKEILEDPSLDSQGTEILIDVLKEVEFDNNDFKELVNYCSKKNITFLCTPWDIPSVDFLEELNIPAYKIASADLTNFPLLHHISKLKKPIIVSTGMSTLEEIDKTVRFLKNENVFFILLHCNSTYPSPIELLNLKLIPELREKFDVPIGYSGHESIVIPSVTAVSLGSVIIERHITLDKNMKGLDQSASLEPHEFKQLVQFVRDAEKSMGKPIKKMTRGEILQREVLGKSIVCSSNIKSGELFSNKNIQVKTPSRGISPQHYFELMGKISSRDLKKGEYLQNEDLP